MKKILSICLLSFLLLSPFISEASFDTNLYYGLQKNDSVRELQEFLIDKGFLSGSVTGNFFSLTLKAVKQYQVSKGISQTGYVGALTRTAINNELLEQLSVSNIEATSETGVTPPAPTPQANTNDIVSNLKSQIALLIQQLQAMQTQQTTNQQIQQNTQQIVQNTQQIVQNTTPTLCSPNWQCGTWSACLNSLQTRTCVDANSCGVLTSKPSVAQSCTVACLPNWTCNTWSDCANLQQTRSCTDSNHCEIMTNKPIEAQSCTPPPVYMSASNYNNNSVYANKGTKIADFLINFSGVNNTNISRIGLSITGDSVDLIKNLTFYNYPDFGVVGGQPKTVVPSLVSGNKMMFDNLNISATGSNTFGNRLLIYADLQDIVSETSITVNIDNIDATGDGNQITDVRNIPLIITTNIKIPYLTVSGFDPSLGNSAWQNTGQPHANLQTIYFTSSYNRVELKKIGFTVIGQTIGSKLPSCPWTPTNSTGISFCFMNNYPMGCISAQSGVPTEVSFSGGVLHVFNSNPSDRWGVTTQSGQVDAYQNSLACADIGTNWKMVINSIEAKDDETGKIIYGSGLPIESGVINFRVP
ncbi:MAG: hypothetical protein A2312_02925 [Candidatus Staskawiczbacteria bacterium RIFOXYB2_FULL_32_9]|uniref:Peptidoglycan binding-like domain-containing protein n=1 Tax=Candidatus Staskawiczbacteria bacterium RIFOXYD1_FULL_32_13 TaxID=1802234 RepID=A0A1G2JR59_9BACT|nr:MAG: Peptidoglycan-binding domain 1 protein [Parcubacteria group bacterium GW2011_GWC2_32_10]OGZ83515.1 MAG: hypothetical protein A2312_02925 [Candidatus Staskawiczbacteria bacterium RIFOXYB2_FULL_32_9]OGZ87468.1 MAG: hypothetical protein A2463_04890 [Candidatus Staskawiczbacteria bacterium RIFOXYC2_FULL_32_10]OGZ89626.1 MAG: hypothetical protein A2561_03785 [Candidatus Staskawiczbacteria bacterium RIFOXYD1_FULL_32_13]